MCMCVFIYIYIYVCVFVCVCVCVSGDGDVRVEQLNLVSRWIDEFQEVHAEEGEMVMFDVLCGDFNFDNCSPGECVCV